MRAAHGCEFNESTRWHPTDVPAWPFWENALMADAGTLHTMFLDELRDSYDAERQLTKALPKLADAASTPDLKRAFEMHLDETRGQIARLEQVFEGFGERPSGKHCDGIAGIIEEGKAIMDEDLDAATMDACLIAAGQRAEHYEMAAYGTLVAWARSMGHDDAAELLQQNLDEESAADEKLTEIAESGINQAAAERAHPNGEMRGAKGKMTSASKTQMPRQH